LLQTACTAISSLADHLATDALMDHREAIEATESIVCPPAESILVMTTGRCITSHERRTLTTEYDGNELQAYNHEPLISLRGPRQLFR
jgi:hypothetical protein